MPTTQVADSLISNSFTACLTCSEGIADWTIMIAKHVQLARDMIMYHTAHA